MTIRKYSVEGAVTTANLSYVLKTAKTALSRFDPQFSVEEGDPLILCVSTQCDGCGGIIDIEMRSLSREKRIKLVPVETAPDKDPDESFDEPYEPYDDSEEDREDREDDNAPSPDPESPPVFHTSCEEELDEMIAELVREDKKKKNAKREARKISFPAAISTVIVSVVLAVLLTFSLTTAYMKSDAPHAVTPGHGTEEKSPFHELEIIDRLFRSATVLEKQDERTLMTAILKSYVAATGDVYAEYFTAAELEEQISSQNGKMSGIGVSVVESTLDYGGMTYHVITVTYVHSGTPAEAAGVLPGDHIMYVMDGEEKILVHDVGYTQAMTVMKGEVGTVCAFSVLRKNPGTDSYEEVPFSITRQEFTTRSVLFKQYDLDNTVGVIRITGFDNNTYPQLVEAVETLKAEGCQSYVLDLRGNPGGLLSSVEDVLTLFLQEGDTMITTIDAAGVETVTKVTANSLGTLTCGSGNLTLADVGKYRDLNFSVLVNEYSASAAELFTSNVRDHKLGTVVGTTTFGKGCGQTTYLLSRYGYEGALKLTSFYYLPPSGEGYDGIGIVPHVTVELSEEAKEYNINLLPHEKDNQLAAAVQALQKD